MPVGNWDAGKRGIVCLPGCEAEFRAGVDRAVEYARALGCGQLNCLTGKAPAGVADEVLHSTFVDNLAHAATAFKRAG